MYRNYIYILYTYIYEILIKHHKTLFNIYILDLVWDLLLLSCFDFDVLSI